MPDGVRHSIERLARADDVRRVAIMPDIHLGQTLCIGVAFATTTLVYPDAVGGDIGCGMAAIALSGPQGTPSDRRLSRLFQAISSSVPIHRHRRSAEVPTHDAPDPSELSTPQLRAIAQKQMPIQIGTLGTGNHFLELQRDEADNYWLMVHSGSRGLGQAIHAHHVAHATNGAPGLRYLDAQSAAGEAYLHDMHWARRFAMASRRAMLLAAARAAESALGWECLEDSLLQCDHNHVQSEEIAGVLLHIHRKGAMPAHSDTPGIVPGSMAAPSYHVMGRGVPDALCSSAHGAGRAMSRSAARSRITKRKLLNELRDVYIDPRVAEGLREEAPSAYKDIRRVMRDQRDLVRVTRTLSPVLTYKGSR